MEKSRNTTDSRSVFFDGKYAHLRHWSWAGLLVGGAVISHAWRMHAWEQRLLNVPRATVPELLCWLDQAEAMTWPKLRSKLLIRPRPAPIASDNHPRGKAQTQSRERRQINVNFSNAEEWEIVPGIGPVLSRRIVKFRNALGGFVSINQLYKVYGLDSSVIKNIEPDLILTPNSHQTICLDSVSFQRLIRHPLFNAEQSRRVLRAWGRGTNLDDFWFRMSASDEERQLWSPYLRTCPRSAG